MTDPTRYTLFKPTRFEQRQATTDNIVRQLADAETAAREKKTERLRKLRLEAEAMAEDNLAKPQRAVPKKRRARA